MLTLLESHKKAQEIIAQYQSGLICLGEFYGALAHVEENTQWPRPGEEEIDPATGLRLVG